MHLRGVIAEQVIPMEPNGRPEYAARAIGRISLAMERRTNSAKWKE